jgi:hypothetical protein
MNLRRIGILLSVLSFKVQAEVRIFSAGDGTHPALHNSSRRRLDQRMVNDRDTFAHIHLPHFPHCDSNNVRIRQEMSIWGIR